MKLNEDMGSHAGDRRFEPGWGYFRKPASAVVLADAQPLCRSRVPQRCSLDPNGPPRSKESRSGQAWPLLYTPSQVQHTVLFRKLVKHVYAVQAEENSSHVAGKRAIRSASTHPFRRNSVQIERDLRLDRADQISRPATKRKRPSHREDWLSDSPTVGARESRHRAQRGPKLTQSRANEALAAQTIRPAMPELLSRGDAGGVETVTQTPTPYWALQTSARGHSPYANGWGARVAVLAHPVPPATRRRAEPGSTEQRAAPRLD
jgi:hypothetical protein